MENDALVGIRLRVGFRRDRLGFFLTNRGLIKTNARAHQCCCWKRPPFSVAFMSTVPLDGRASIFITALRRTLRLPQRV